MNGVATWTGRRSGSAVGFSLSTFDCGEPLTQLLHAHALASPALLRARAAAVRYELGVAAATGREAPVPFTWAGCRLGIAVNDPTLDVVESLVHLTWRRFERAPPFAGVTKGRYDSGNGAELTIEEEGSAPPGADTSVNAAYKRGAWDWLDLIALSGILAIDVLINRSHRVRPTGDRAAPRASIVAHRRRIVGRPPRVPLSP